MQMSNETIAPTGFNLANFLRLMGGGSVLLAGSIYMLQGLTSSDMGLRNWIIILLMLALTSAGLACRFFLQDGISARLLLTLATAMFPIQCSQLGSNLLQADNSHGLVTLITAVGSLIMLPALWLGFSVLLRPFVLRISLAFIVLCSAIILPIRTEPTIFVLIAIMIIGLFALQQKWIPALKGAKNLDVIVVRSLLLLPVLIVLTRQGYYIRDTNSSAMLAASLAALLITQGLSWSGISGVKDVFIMLGTIVLAFAFYLCNLSTPTFLTTTTSLWLMAGCLYLLQGQLFYLASLYRKMANILIFSSLLVTSSETFNSAMLSWFLSMLVLSQAIKYREKLSLLGGSIMLLLSLANLVGNAFSHLQVHYWLSLAAGGILLVILASAMERYGKQCVELSKNYWLDIKSWDY